MANTFKVVSHDVMPASAGTPEDLYTTPSSTTTTDKLQVDCSVADKVSITLSIMEIT